jgi:hypothetical protein
MQATIERYAHQAPRQETAGWTARITNVVHATRAATTARAAMEATTKLAAAEAFDERRQRLEAVATSVFEHAGELLGRLGATTRTTTALRDSVPRLPRAFDVAFHLDGIDQDASLVLTVVEGYDHIKAVRCLSPRRIGTDVVKHGDVLPAAELTDHAVGELAAALVEDFFGSPR